MLQLKFLLSTCAIIFAFNFQLIKSSSEIYENERLEKLREIVKGLRSETSASDSHSCVNSYNHSCTNKEVYFSNPNFAFVDYEYLLNLNESDPKISESEKKLRNYLSSCYNKNENYVGQLKNLEIGKKIGGWPFFTPNWTGEKFNLAEIYGKLNRYGIRTNFILQLTPMTFNFYLYFNPDLIYNESEICDQFKKYDITTELFDIQEVAKEIIEFNTKITKLWKNDQQFENYTLEELKEKCPEFDWNQLFETYFNQSAEYLPSTIQVTLSSLETFKSFINFLQKYDKKKLANYVMWKMIVSEFQPWNYKCNDIEYDKLYLLNPILSKVSIQKAYNEVNGKIYLGAFEEVKNLLESLKSQSLIKPSTFESEMNKIKKGIELITSHSDYVIDNEIIDFHYSDMEITLNFLQNFYNLKEKELELRLDYNITKKVSDLFGFFRTISDMVEYYSPSFVVFNNFISSFWNELVRKDLIETDKLETASKCIQEHLPETGFGEVKQRIVYNEALRLTLKTYESWLEKNPEIKEKESKVLAEFNMNHRDLLLAYKTRGDCNGDGGDKRKDIINDVIYCSEDGKIACSIYDI